MESGTVYARATEVTINEGASTDRWIGDQAEGERSVVTRGKLDTAALRIASSLRTTMARATGRLAAVLAQSGRQSPQGIPVFHGGLPAGAAAMSSPMAAAAVIQSVIAAHGKLAGVGVVNWIRGPAVIQFRVRVPPNVKPSALDALEESFAVALGVSSVRVVHPLSVGGVVGVEVPLPVAYRRTVPLATLLAHPGLRNNPAPLLIALGAAVDGAPVVPDLTRLPHLLVAGATNTGKSTALNAIIMSLITRNTPQAVRLILLDPKRVELAQYAGVPHLERPIVTDLAEAKMTLGWVLQEIERRYTMLADAGARNVAQYNAAALPLPYLVVVIDEFASLVDDDDQTAGNVIDIGRLGRAVGVHLVLATQRPDVKTVTGQIKANIPARLALATASAVDSRVIIDRGGAETLIGAGDALFAPGGAGAPLRLQVAIATDREIELTTSRMAVREEPPITWVADAIAQEAATAAATTVQPERAERVDQADLSGETQLLVKAAELVVTSQFGSTSMLQRKLRVGFAKAGALIDRLESLGVVGPLEGTKARAVLVPPERLNQLLTKIVEEA